MSARSLQKGFARRLIKLPSRYWHCFRMMVGGFTSYCLYSETSLQLRNKNGLQRTENSKISNQKWMPYSNCLPWKHAARHRTPFFLSRIRDSRLYSLFRLYPHMDVGLCSRDVSALRRYATHPRSRNIRRAWVEPTFLIQAIDGAACSIIQCCGSQSGKR